MSQGDNPPNGQPPQPPRPGGAPGLGPAMMPPRPHGAPPLPPPAPGVVAQQPAPQPPSAPLPAFTDPSLTPLAARASMIESEPSVDIPPPTHLPPTNPEGPKLPDPYIGTTFDHRYKIEKLLGEGGMGCVYLARHKVIGKKVAVKVLRAEHARDRELVDRFVQEARAASSIGNPHIIDISDFGELPDGSTYFVMEHLDGRSLAELLMASPRLDVPRLCNIVLQLCDGLAAAHEQGIVHRDLKPDNILLVARSDNPDFAKIVDFGIAKVSGSAETKLTRAGAVFGTPHYMSPEQAAGSAVDHRTDIYSLGVILYEMTAGVVPFNAENFMGILTQHMYKAPVPIRALVPAPSCPPGLEAIILKCLSKKPEQRYPTMRELAADLTLLRDGQVPLAVSEMMGRSGGFNVPHDYFKPQQGRQIIPATPRAPSRAWPRYVWVAGVLSAVGIVGAIFAKGALSKAEDPRAAVAGSASATSATTNEAPLPTGAPPATTTATAEASTSAAAPKVTIVAVSSNVSTAIAKRDGAELKLPTAVTVEEGKPVSLEVSARGYVTQTISLDGSEASVLVKLARVPSAVTPKANNPQPRNNGVIDPNW